MGFLVVFGLEADVFRVRGSVGALLKRAKEGCPFVYVFFYLLLRESYGFRLVARHAMESPGEERHAFCKGGFQASYRSEILYYPAQASVFLSEQVTEALEGCSHGVVSSALGASFSSPDRFLLSINPPDLLSLAYVRFAHAIVDRAPMVECPGCGRTFIPKSGKQKYCTKSCASTSRWRRWKEKQTDIQDA